jgi:carbon storage regulator
VLILTRRPGERVVIDEDILITVMGVSGHTVRLGITAPEGVSIYREEIWLAVKEENSAAAAADRPSLPTSPPEARAPGAAAAPESGAAPEEKGAREAEAAGGDAPGGEQEPPEQGREPRRKLS